jgi:hypothetical protein
MALHVMLVSLRQFGFRFVAVPCGYALVWLARPRNPLCMCALGTQALATSVARAVDAQVRVWPAL